MYLLKEVTDEAAPEPKPNLPTGWCRGRMQGRVSSFSTHCPLLR